MDDNIQLIRECYAKLEKFDTSTEKLKVVYGWVKSGHINFKTFCHLVQMVNVL